MKFSPGKDAFQSKISLRASLEKALDGVTIGKHLSGVVRRKLGSFFATFSDRTYQWHIDKAILELARMIKVWGPIKTWSYAKLQYAFARDYVIGRKPMFDQSLFWTKTTKSGFPRNLLFLKGLLHGSESDKRAAISILSMYRLIRSKPQIDVTSITSPTRYSELPSKYRKSFTNKTKLLRKRADKSLPDSYLFLSSKKGPNGPAIDAIGDDAKSLEKDPKLLESIYKLYLYPTVSNNPTDIEIGDKMLETFSFPIQDQQKGSLGRAERRLQIFSNALWETPKKSNPVHSRIAGLSAEACKTRTVAIADYFSQDALKPIHEWSFRLLKRIDQDGTFGHDQIALLMKRNTFNGKPWHCFDLTTATDRFPVSFQKNVLEQLTDSSLADGWYDVMTQRKFQLPNGDFVEYKAGQPMGLLSSWAIFALSHHIVVQMAAEVSLKRSDWFEEYCIIGDDIAIFNPSVADEYQNLLSILDVPISPIKSMISKGKPDDSFGEIAKRVFINGREITPIPPGILLESIRDPRSVSLLIRFLRERGLEQFSTPDSILPLLNILVTNKQSKRVILALLFHPDGRKAVFPYCKEEPNFAINPWAGLAQDEPLFAIMKVQVEKILKQWSTIAQNATVESLQVGLDNTPLSPRSLLMKRCLSIKEFILKYLADIEMYMTGGFLSAYDLLTFLDELEQALVQIEAFSTKQSKQTVRAWREFGTIAVTLKNLSKRLDRVRIAYIQSCEENDEDPLTAV